MAEGNLVHGQAMADRHAANILPVILDVRRAGVTSLHQIAGALNARGVTRARGGCWYASSVSNVLAQSLIRCFPAAAPRSAPALQALMTTNTESSPRTIGIEFSPAPLRAALGSGDRGRRVHVGLRCGFD